MTQQEIFNIIYAAAYEVRLHLAPGYLEGVYRNALLYELRLRGLNALEEVLIPVQYKGMVIGNYRADIVVENSIIIELKAVKENVPAHAAQLINYLMATGFDYGFIINYGGDKLTCQLKTRIYHPKTIEP